MKIKQGAKGSANEEQKEKMDTRREEENDKIYSWLMSFGRANSKSHFFLNEASNLHNGFDPVFTTKGIV